MIAYSGHFFITSRLLDIKLKDNMLDENLDQPPKIGPIPKFPKPSPISWILLVFAILAIVGGTYLAILFDNPNIGIVAFIGVVFIYYIGQVFFEHVSEYKSAIQKRETTIATLKAKELAKQKFINHQRELEAQLPKDANGLAIVDHSKRKPDDNLKNAKYVILKIETTGLDREKDEIIEFAGVKIWKGKIIARKQFFINIHKTLSPSHQLLTKIDNQHIASGLEGKQAMKEMFNFFEDAVLIGHYINDFDMVFIKRELKKHGLPPLKNYIVDANEIRKIELKGLKIINAKFKFTTICRKYDVSYNADIGKRAYYDAEIMAKIFLKMLDRLANDNVNTFKDLERAIKKVRYIQKQLEE